MNRKRSLPLPVSDLYRRKRRFVAQPQQQLQQPQQDEKAVDSEDGLWNSELPDSSFPNDAEATMLYLKDLFPVEKFQSRLPPIIVKHQLYSMITNRTLADKQLGELRTRGDVRMFKMSTSEADEFCLVFTEDYKRHVILHTVKSGANLALVERFFDTVIKECPDISFDKQKLMTQYKFKEEEIHQLIKCGVLNTRDVGSWWLSIPDLGIFIKSFLRGRKAVITMIRKSKYREILQQDLETRKLPKVARLGMMYHIHDIIGADLVDWICTTSGRLLRLTE
ncbi:inactive serine/threonine-protein kinase 19-like [Lineus longissimus]|uniref:inactive serine/threonine-protein kinase 19-like n=1 Tax=Lineus longissimus TaxID=88925 RepID=UPI002B4CDF0A